MEKLKIPYKGLLIYEAGYIYFKRHNLDFTDFDNIIFEIDSLDKGEFKKISDDLRYYLYKSNYVLQEITLQEYKEVVELFNTDMTYEQIAREAKLKQII